MRTLTLLSLSILLTASLAAEEAKKPLSPPAKAEATIGGKQITIDYSAPSKRNRTIMGELVPFDQVWRTGANAATKLTTTGDLMIGNVHVPAGTYTLFTIPAKDHWTLIVSKQTGLWGTNKYDEKQDLGRVRMTVKPVADTVETFAINVKSTGDKTGALSLTWENTLAIVPIVVH